MRTIATVGGLGYSPMAPGTLGSAVGLGIAWILSGDFTRQIAGCFAAVLLTLWSAGPTSKALGDPDPKQVIIDEVAGMMIGLAGLPVTGPVYLSGFLLFRFLDVVKPPPLRQIQRLPGSWGILLDDVGAGLATNLALRLMLDLLR